MTESWSMAVNPDEVHQLLLMSDGAAARAYAPAPRRNMESTRRHVAEGHVHMLRRDGVPDEDLQPRLELRASGRRDVILRAGDEAEIL